jgi:hypothetical protein
MVRLMVIKLLRVADLDPDSFRHFTYLRRQRALRKSESAVYSRLPPNPYP